jgi:hypothetical protein
MAERIQENRHSGRFKRPRRGLWLVAVAVLGLAFFAVLCLTPTWRQKSVERRLAAIYAAHVLPPEENAATIYNRLLTAYLRKELRVPTPGLPTDSNSISSLQSSEEERMQVLLEAATRPRCSFPALCDSAGPVAAMKWMKNTTAKRTSMMRLPAWSILAAGLDDLDQGRLDAAREKLYCVVQVSAHLRQQPTYEDFFSARGVEDLLWSAVGQFIVERDATDEHLAVIEGILPRFEDAWEEESADMRQVEILLDTRSLWRRLRDALDGRGPRHAIGTCELNYREILCERRGVRLLIELRRCRNRSGRWPDSLDEIRAQVPPEALSDPLGAGELIYETEPGGFHLYSMGRNNKKDAGKGDDYYIWSRRGVLKWLQERQWEDAQTTGGQIMPRKR